MAREIVKADLIHVENLITKVLGNTKIANVERMGGLTNHTYKVTVSGGEQFVVRLPGEGTEEMINRRDEKTSTELACRIGIDADMLYFGENGVKVTRYIANAQTMNAELLRCDQNIEKAAQVLRVLHNCGEDTKVPFEVFEMAETYEKVISNNHIAMYDDYDQIKAQVMEIKKEVDKNGRAALVPCHNDPLCENWVLGDEKMYLIDWEYAGMNDGMWDLADVSIEAAYQPEHDMKLLQAYYGKTPTQDEKKRFLANKLYLDFLWTLWGKTRVPFDGDAMEEYALERYLRLKENLKEFEKEK